MSNLLESDVSPVKKHAIETTKQHIRGLTFQTKRLSPALLTRLGMIDEESDIHHIKLVTTTSVTNQLEFILQDHEFSTEISNPVRILLF